MTLVFVLFGMILVAALGATAVLIGKFGIQQGGAGRPKPPVFTSMRSPDRKEADAARSSGHPPSEALKRTPR